VHFSRTSSASFNSTASPVLTLIKSASATDLYPGRETIFTLTVANNGGSTAYVLAVADTLPALLEYVTGSALPAAGAVFGPSPGTGGRLFWLIPSLPPGGGLAITFRARALDPGGSAQAVTNTASVGASLPVPSGATGSAVVTVRPNILPSPPGSLSTVVRGGAVELTWAVSSPGSDPVSGYHVYRGSYPGWTPLAGHARGNRAGASTTAYGDPGAAAVGYCYVVRAFDSDGLESTDSNRACVVAPPSPPSALSALFSGTSVVLTWQASAPGSTPVSGYRMYRGTFAGWTPSAGNLVGTVWGATTLSFADPSPPVGADTRYVVRAFDEGGRESGDSNEAMPVRQPTIRLIVEVFDVTGRLVRTLADRRVYAAAGVASVGNGSGAVRIDTASPAVIMLTDGTRLTWDGLDSTGMRLPNGIYVVRATAEYPDGRRAVATNTFTLARAYERLVESVILVPNPAAEAAWISLGLASSLSTVEVRIYNVAGELVFKGSIPGTARSWRWDLRNGRGYKVASGLYVIALDVRDEMTGARERVIRKLAVSDR
jgi:uncharacterized repeat protein (TIGR01451 family)